MIHYSTTQSGRRVVDAAASQAAKVIDIRARRNPASQGSRTRRGAPRKPAWIWLYALLPLNFLLFALADLVPAASLWRYCTESLAVLLIIGAALLWTRLNRRALMPTIEDLDADHSDLRPTT